MKYVTTNIRLPEDLWKELKIEAANQRKRLTEIIREKLSSVSAASQIKAKKPTSLRGIWKGIDIPDSAIEEAKHSLFPSPEKFFK